MHRQRILVAGCGYVGSALAMRLAADGHDVFGLRRSARALPPGVTPILGDIARLEALPPALDAVCYTAAPDAYTDDAYRATFVDGPRHLLDALRRSGSSPRRILFTSSTAVYAQAAGEWVDETSEARPSGFSGARLLEGESVFHSGPFPATVLRLGGIYGPGRSGQIERVRRREARLRATPFFTNRIHRDDSAGTLRHLLGVAAPLPLYVGVDCEPADEGDVLRWLAHRLGVSLPGLAEPVGDVPPARPRGSKRCSNARLLASGYRFEFPTFREGYEALLAVRP